jgi:hypothetical protein
LLATDAQPDGTVGVKRFWKGNFLFNTKDVVGEPGFKAFRPIIIKEGKLFQVTDSELDSASGHIPYSLQQRKMETDLFYHTMEKLINPRPLDPEAAMLNLIDGLYEQLLVRVTSVANGEAYLKANPGTIVPMPTTSAGIFQTGGMWENYSTPNRDLRLLIAMDAVEGFPDLITRFPSDYNLPPETTPEEMTKKLKELLKERTASLSISYTRSDGSVQKLSLADILSRKDAFEIGYNPNDCIEVRWGAPENSPERSTGRRFAPESQKKVILNARTWFSKRLHPPT